jgi:hypothetical protein
MTEWVLMAVAAALGLLLVIAIGARLVEARRSRWVAVQWLPPAAWDDPSDPPP